MTAPGDRTKVALLVIDMQNAVVATSHERDAVVANIDNVVAKARAGGVPVLWVQHDDEGLTAGTNDWQIVPELDPQPSEPIISKHYRDSFQHTTLEAELAARDVGALVIAGAQTDFCVRWTLHGAQARGYDSVLVADGHTTDAISPAGLPSGAELIAHTNNIWASQADSDHKTSVIRSADISFS